MSKLQKNLTLWAALLSLVFALSVRPALAQTTSPSPQASPNPSDSEKKKSKSKKEKSTDAQTGQNSTGAPASDSGTSKKSKKEKTSETSPETTKPSAATKTETSSSDTGTTKKSKKSTKSEDTSAAGAPSTPTKTAETSKPVESKPALPQTDKPAGGGKTESGGASAAEIASAQAGGKVWVNLDSGIYHKGGQYYGHTKNGKFMTEAEAQKAGYREAKK